MKMRGCGEKSTDRLVWLWNTIRVICIVVIAMCMIMLVQALIESQSVDEINRNLQSLYRADAETLFEATPAPTTPPIEDALMPVYNENHHTVGWLTVGDDISLPVVQYDDNDFYLKHDFYGSESRAGTLFMDKRCCLWPNNAHWMIHGHNMKDGSMFGTLDDYRNIDYLRQYPTITFHSLYEKYSYIPIAIFDASMTKGTEGYFRIARFNFDSGEEFRQFIDEIRAKSIFNIPVNAHEEDQLLTLVTCSYFHDNGRLLVVCRRLRDGENIADAAELVRQAENR